MNRQISIFENGFQDSYWILSANGKWHLIQIDVRDCNCSIYLNGILNCEG